MGGGAQPDLCRGRSLAADAPAAVMRAARLRTAVRGVWEVLFRSSPDAACETD
jgi:hypothetical protein